MPRSTSDGPWRQYNGRVFLCHCRHCLSAAMTLRVALAVVRNNSVPSMARDRATTLPCPTMTPRHAQPHRRCISVTVVTFG